jgi:ribonuclease III
MLEKIFHLFSEKRDPVLARFELALDYKFKDQNLLKLALVHRSFAAECAQDYFGRNNERLEFLGDSVLNMLVTDFLYCTYPTRDEGELSKFKAKMVSGTSLARAAEALQLGEYLYVSKGERKTGGHKKVSILEDGFEALVGAMYLDGGIGPCKVFLREYLLKNIEDILQDDSLINYKSLLLEHCQGSQQGVPGYRLLREDGPEHEKLFVMQAVLDGAGIGEGSGTSKKRAEQLAAKDALENKERWDKSAETCTLD